MHPTGPIVGVDRTVLSIDAGHLLSGGGSPTVAEHRRSCLDVEVCELAAALADRVERDAEPPLLRTYWYDGAPDGRLSAESSPHCASSTTPSCGRAAWCRAGRRASTR